MRKTLLLLLVFFIPSLVYAEIDVFLSADRLPYSATLWTSNTTPDLTSDTIFLQHDFYREDIPKNYKPTAQEFHDMVNDLFSDRPEVVRSQIYQSFIRFDTYGMAPYLGVAISPETDTKITEKNTMGMELTPYESVFESCGIDLTNRRAIARDFFEKIHAGTFSSISNIEYLNIRFGDCIIPFPDSRRGTNIISNSFSSNKLIARSRAGNPLRFPDTLEQSATILQSSDTASDELRELLEMNSTRLESDLTLNKEHGKNRIHYVHKNHYINPFVETHIKNEGGYYRVGGSIFDENHYLYISHSDSESERLLLEWTEIQPGIYKKILVQEDTYESISGKIIPRQVVGATTYYAIIYNYDLTPPLRKATFFSHDSEGDDIFSFSGNTWFNETKYGYFLCSDIESGCYCDTAIGDCFKREGGVLSLPQPLEHEKIFSATLVNTAGLTQSVSSDVESRILYDMQAPDLRLEKNNTPLVGVYREYVSNNSLIYDGENMTQRRLYHVGQDLEFEADESIDLNFDIYDPLLTGNNEGRSGLAELSIRLGINSGDSWEIQTIEHNSFSNTTNNYSLSLADINSAFSGRNIMTQAGEYQILFDVRDIAGNISRIAVGYTIIPGEINPGRSTLTSSEKNTLYADNTSSYLYTLTLRDEYGNIISGRQVHSIGHNCSGIPNCKKIRTSMLGTQSGPQALKIFDESLLSDSKGRVFFRIRSVAPGEFTERFRVSFLNPSIEYSFQADTNSFLAPLVGTLETLDVSDGWVDDRLIVGELTEYRIHVENQTSRTLSWDINNFSSYLSARHPDTDFSLSGSLDKRLDGMYFRGTFTSNLDTNESHKTLLEIVRSDISAVEISYRLDAEDISYLLSSEILGQSPLTLTDTRPLKNPVKIIGELQAIGNTHNTEERQNIGDIDTNFERSIIRKNIASMTLNQVSNTTINGIKFVDMSSAINKNYLLESDPSFETLIVKNGNILIENDFNLLGEKIGLISYIDQGYNTRDGYNSIGNIYIDADVSSIQAFIYADGALISTENGSPIDGNNPARKQILNSQLQIYGALFSRNTLAGSIEFGGRYILPGGSASDDEALAKQYDLYHIRRGNQGCERDSYDFCNRIEYLIIEYDSRIKSDPPKLFSQ